MERERQAEPPVGGGRLRLALALLAAVVLTALLVRGATGSESMAPTGGSTLMVRSADGEDDRPEMPDDRAGIAPQRSSPAWERLPLAPIAGRTGHSAVWTGEEMLVWGGTTSEPEAAIGDRDGRPTGDAREAAGHRAPDDAVTTSHADGAAYDSDARTWRVLPDAPLAGRYDHTGVWTGREMLVWGGVDGTGTPLADGAAYDPAADSWRRLARAPLAGRALHTGIWTGEELLIWGGRRRGLGSGGAAYDPAGDTWRSLPEAPVPGRLAHTAVWTGEEMLVWGGVSPQSVVGGGGLAYDPATDAWRTLPPAPLEERVSHAAAWDGRRMLVWGGAPPRQWARAPAPDHVAAHADGAAYDPRADAWEPLPAAGIDARIGPAAVWTGEKLLIWGGGRGPASLDGAAYDPDRRTWRPIPAAPAAATAQYPAVWTGSVMLVWAGVPEAAGAALDPAELSGGP